MTIVEIVSVSAVFAVAAIFWYWMTYESQVPRLKQKICDLESQLRASRSTSHQLALYLRSAKRQFPTLKLDAWANCRIEKIRKTKDDD